MENSSDSGEPRSVEQILQVVDQVLAAEQDPERHRAAELARLGHEVAELLAAQEGLLAAMETEGDTDENRARLRIIEEALADAYSEEKNTRDQS